MFLESEFCLPQSTCLIPRFTNPVESSSFVMARARTKSDGYLPIPTTTPGRPTTTLQPPKLTPQRPLQPPQTKPFSGRQPNTTRLEDELLSEIKKLEEKLSRSATHPPIHDQPSHHRSTPQSHSAATSLHQTRAAPRMSTTTPTSPPSHIFYHENTVPQVMSSAPPQLNLMPSYQVKNVPVFSGREGSNVPIDDWIRDTRYLLDSTTIPSPMRFLTIVRYLGGAARKLVLNLPPEQQTVDFAFDELRSQFGELSTLGDPLADFYQRERFPNESPSIYAVELEATLRSVEEWMGKRIQHHRNNMLTQQFMRGVRDERVTQRLAPMKPRDMNFHELQVELRQLERETRMSSISKSSANIEPKQLARANPQQLSNKVARQTPQPSDKHQMQQKTDHDVLQDLVSTVRQLAERVDKMSVKPRAQRPTQDPQRVFICHKCGQEGHIARGCRSVPLNYLAPRPTGKSSEGPKPPAR